MSEQIQVKLAQPERHFIKVYTDFFNCKLLTANEKMAYIALKNFLSYGENAGKVYPSVDTLSEICGLTRKALHKAINGLEQKKVIKKERRGLSKPNLYTLNDVPEMWKAETEDEMKALSESRISLSTDEMIEELIKRGFWIDKKERLISQPPQQEISVSKNTLLIDTGKNYNIKEPVCQYDEKYPMEFLKAHYEYDAIAFDKGEDEAEALFNILYDALNSDEEKLKIGGNYISQKTVSDRLLKLDMLHLEYVLDKYHSRKNKIEKPEAYILTLCYHAKEQQYFEVMNTGHVNGSF